MHWFLLAYGSLACIDYSIYLSNIVDKGEGAFLERQCLA